MIPRAFIQEWSNVAPWVNERQIEQDLIISRALCDLFSSAKLSGKIAFRGGTAINKLVFVQALRYSEDIDLIQTQEEPIKGTIEAIQEALSWLGKFNIDQRRDTSHLEFKFSPESTPDSPMKLKLEINTREHTNLLGLRKYSFSLENGWFNSKAEIISFEPEELFGTKLRALLQRRKNRDLFDLSEGLKQLSLEPNKLIDCFHHYLSAQGMTITRAMAEQRMLEKLKGSLVEDISPLLPAGNSFSDEDAIEAFNRVWTQLISLIPGEPWKSTEEVIIKVRSKIPNFLK